MGGVSAMGLGSKDILILTATFLTQILGFSFSSKAVAENITPGTCKCYGPSDLDPASIFGTAAPQGDRYVRGLCKYQAQPLGDEIYQKLLKLSRLQVKDWIAGLGFSRDNLEPTVGKEDFSIIWWFEDQRSNERMCSFLQRNDGLARVFNTPTVRIAATMYSFEKGSERDLGLQVGAFYGKQPPQGASTGGATQTQPTPLFGNGLAGVFSGAMGFGNPLASFLNLGIIATANRRQAQKIVEVVYACELGSSCNYTHARANYFVHPLGTKDDSIGLQIQTTAMIDPDDPTLVRLENLSLRYSVSTDDPKAPVDVYQPYAFRDGVFRTHQLYVIGSESTRTDVRTGKMIEVGTQHAHSQFLILLSVSVFRPEAGDKEIQNPKDLPLFQFEKDDRSYTAAELAALPNGQYSLKDILSSVQLTCYNDVLNPSISEKICGFQFAKMDRKYVAYRLHAQMAGKVRYPTDHEIYWKVGDLYTGKGYYQIPRAQETDSGSNSNFELTLELDPKSVVTREVRKSEPVKGMKIPFTYYSGSTDPIQWDPDQIKWITK
jgi:hypothetical protein